MPKYLIAGLKVEFEPKYPLLTERSEKYLHDFSGEADIKFDLTEETIDKMIEKVPVVPRATAEYMGTAIMFYYKLLNHNGFLLHSSCIGYRGKAYLFTADPGTGKSTHTGLWKKFIPEVEFINDDKPAIRLIDGTYYACGTPWSGKTSLNSDVLIPVGGVALLHRGLKNTIDLSETGKAVTFILKQTQIPDQKDALDRMVYLLDGFVRNTPIYDLACDMSEDAVKTSFEALTGEEYAKRT
ncbi:MAG: hypothetical protein E7525_00870 [Ruminococcaceae bacterium]|nr:hypothetical protein [Oscillospiraceae bacterium]